MRKSSIMGALVIAGIVLSASCSKNNVPVASYFDGKKTVTVKVGDIKDIFLSHMRSAYYIVGNAKIHSDYIYNQVIIPSLILQEMVYTNDPAFEEAFRIFSYAKRGRDNLGSDLGSMEIEVARASQILVTAAHYTNGSNNSPVPINGNDYTNYLSNRQAFAQGLLDTLNKSANPATFSNLAVKNSGDNPSASSGGDMGYFIRGTASPKEFEDAVFSAGKTGLIGTPVKSDLGYQIINVTSLPKKMTFNAYARLIGKAKFARVAPSLSNYLVSLAKKENLTNYFTINPTNKMILLDGKAYTVTGLPGDQKLYSIYDKPYTWKDNLDIVHVIDPEFTNTPQFTNTDFFRNFINSLSDLLFYRDYTIRTGLDKKPLTSIQAINFDQQVIREQAFRKFRGDSLSNITAQIAQTDLINLYNTSKSNYTKTINKVQVIESFADVSNNIKKDLVNTRFNKFFGDWTNSMFIKYKVKLYQNGLKTLYGIEQDIMKSGEKPNPKMRQPKPVQVPKNTNK